jgi:site-specific DNA-methyltransferase (adenine-specific)
MTANIYLGDCQQAFEMGKKWDLAIVDPPYGIGEDGSKNHTRGKIAKAKDYKPFSGNDKEPPAKGFFDDIRRYSQNQIIWGANHFISKIPFDSSCWVVWDKENGESDFADCELAWTSFSTAVRRLKFRWAGMLQEDMKNKETRVHPTQKPVALYKWLLKNYAKPGDTILDTHGGSMSIVIACIEMGFDIDIWEKDPDYFAAAKKRIENHVKQLPLFGPVPTINFYQ